MASPTPARLGPCFSGQEILLIGRVQSTTMQLWTASGEGGRTSCVTQKRRTEPRSWTSTAVTPEAITLLAGRRQKMWGVSTEKLLGILDLVAHPLSSRLPAAPQLEVARAVALVE